jgi:putative protease
LDKPILVRSAGLVQSLQEAIHPPLYGDFSLNTANALTAQLFLAMGLVRITPTHDLNAAQVEALAQSIGPQAIEAIAYQHLPVFHMEHCVFCRFLSQGTSYKDCGHPCETHRLALRDLTGREQPVLADVGCRNTVFGSEAQQAASFLASWQRAGIRHLRLEFAHESAQEVALVTSLFQSALHGEITQQELERRLRRAAPRGITQGSLFVPNEIPLITL